MVKNMKLKSLIEYREEVKKSDLQSITEILESSGFFYSYEVDVALELLEDRLEKGKNSQYNFLFGEIDGKAVAFTCFVRIECTVSSYDIYWIATHNDFRGKGIGQNLLQRTENIVHDLGGTRIYIETAGRELYKPTQAFYARCGYIQEAVLKDFYSEGDDKIINVKVIE